MDVKRSFAMRRALATVLGIESHPANFSDAEPLARNVMNRLREIGAPGRMNLGTGRLSHALRRGRISRTEGLSTLLCQRSDAFLGAGFLAHSQASAYAFAMPMLTIKQMSRAEQLQAMEELWESLSRDEDRLESPDWHADALEETRQSYAAGREQPVDWETAKQELRKRSE